MDYNELISIIVPVYNVMNFLNQCIESLVNQTYKNIEIILINDGSTDNCRQICEKWVRLDSRIRLINQENQGLGYARNVGIMKAKGELITFVDSDDWILHDAIEKMLIIMLREDADLCTCNFYNYDNADGSMSYVDMNLSKEVNNVASFDYPHIWGRLYKKSSFIDNDIWMPSYPYEDLATFPVIQLLANKVSFTKEALYMYRVNTGKSITDNRSNLKYYPTVFRYLTMNAKRLHLFDAYQDTFLQICISHARNALLRAQTFSDMDYFYKLKKEIFLELKSGYPNWNYDEERCLWSFGSFNLCRALSYFDPSYNVMLKNNENAFVFTSIISSVSDPIRNYSLKKHPNSFRDKMIDKDMNKCFMQINVGKKDVILIDLLEEHYSILYVNGTYITKSDAFEEIYTTQEARTVNLETIEGRKLWEDKANIFAKNIQEKFDKTNVFLIEVYAAEINSKGEALDHVDRIQSFNDRLEHRYHYLANILTGVNIIKIPRQLIYTDENSKYGNHPFYINTAMHKYIAYKINELLALNQ